MAGSLNLLSPTDKTPQNDAIELRNFRVDQEGVLRGSDSYWNLGTAPNGAPIHTIFKLDNFTTTQPYASGIIPVNFGGYSNSYFSIKGAFLVGAGTNLYYWYNGSFGPGGGLDTLLIQGLSGKRLSIVVWNGFIWVLDSLNQFKINPYTLANSSNPALAVSLWLPPVPQQPGGSSAPFITATDAGSGSGGSLSGNYDYYCTYVTFTNGFAEEGAAGLAETVLAVGGAIAITGIPYVTSWANYNPGTPALPIGAIRIYRAPAGTPFYLGGTNPNPAMLFLTQFGLGPTPVSDGMGGYIQCTVAYTPTCVSLTDPYVDTGVNSGQGGPYSPAAYAPSIQAGLPGPASSAISAIGGYDIPSSSGAVGTYQYYITWVNSAGLETNPSNASASVTPSDGKVNLSWPQPPTGQDIVRQRIYRTGGTLGNAYQVIEIADNTTNSYTDSASDLALTETGIIMPTTNDPPPTGLVGDNMGMVGPYFNYLIAWKNGKMYWSQDGVALFPGSEDGESVGNWVNVGQADDQIQDMTTHSQVLAIYKQRSVWTVYGDIITGQLTPSGATSGIIGKGCVANCGQYDLALGPDGVYRFDMWSIHCVSDKVSPIFMGQRWLNPGFSDLVEGQRGQDVFGTPQYPFICFTNELAMLGNGGGSSGDLVGTQLTYHPTAERWCNVAVNDGKAITAATGYGNGFVYFVGDAIGNLFLSRQLQGNAPTVWQTRFMDQGLGDTPKWYQEVVIDAELNGALMMVWLLFNATSTAGSLSTISAPYKFSGSGTNRQKFYMPIPEDWGDVGPYHISVRIEITPFDQPTSVLPPPAIHGLYIYYGFEERDASIRGAQVLDFRSERIQIAQRIEVDMVGEANIIVYTDLPNGLTQRYVFSGSLVDRKIFEFKLPPNVRGRLWRVDVLPQGSGSTPTARVYSVRAWMREVGTAQAESWQWKDFLRGPDAELPETE